MQKHLRILAFSLMAAGFALPAVAQDSETFTSETVLATVNGEDITLGHVIAARATLDERYNDVPADQLYAGILQQMIQQTALAQTVETLPDLIVLTLENEQRSLRAGQAIEERLQEAVTDADIQAAYDAQFANIDPQEEFNASHILVETEEEAAAIKEMIDGGANFAQTAREKSTGPSGPNGGQLGWFGTGMMVPSFEAATIALEAGQVSDPVQTQFGWHVILLNETRQAEIPTLDQMRDQIQSDLANTAATQIIEGATDNAEVVVPELTGFDPALISQQDLLD